jgi:glycosyltransferase involved in cell wall biosynthesis
MSPGDGKSQTGNCRGKRVLMLIENGPYSEDGRVRCEANSLTAAGYRVTVIGPASQGERWYEVFDGVTVYQYPPPFDAHGMLGYMLEYSYALSVMAALTLWVAVRHGFDVIHAHNPPDFLVLIGGFWRLFGKRFVFDQHDLSPDMYLSRFSQSSNRTLHRILLYFERLSCRVADHVIATNESCKRLQMERSGIPANRITIVRNGPEPWHLQRFEPDESLRGSAPHVFGYVGMMGQQDGIDYLLRALHILRFDHKRSDWRCILIGRGPAMRALQQLAEQLEIADKVHFTGWVDYEKVPRYIAATDICVVPDPSSDYNDHSTIVKVMEYMAQAKPVVAFDLPEHRVTAGDTALYARPNEEPDFARQLLRLMDDPGLRKRMGEAGQRRVMEQFTWERQEQHLLEVYRTLVGGVRVPQQEIVEQRELATLNH